MNCKKCGKKANSEFCFFCKSKKPLSSGKGLYNIKISKKEIVNTLTDLIYGKEIKLKEFFMKCWKNKPHYSEISRKFLGNSYSSLYQHHILNKSKYPEACFDEENIVFLTPEEHASVELDMYKYELINEKRKQLKIKYNIL